MSDPLTTVSAIYAAFGRGDIPTILDHLADDVRFEEWDDNHAQRAGVPWLQARSGKAGVVEFFGVMGAMQMRDFRVLSLLAGGNQVAAEIEIEFAVPDTGRTLRDQELHLWTCDDTGKVVRLRHYVDTAKHMAAAQA
jgi:hypothetical protein